MSYDLELRFKPAIDRDRFLEHFLRRQHYELFGDTLAYEHPHTHVSFTIDFKTRTSLLLRRMVTSADFEVPYVRPSYWALEADIELRALMAEFPAAIFDPQMRGMGDGPYTTEGFLAGWSFGNELAVQSALQQRIRLQGLPKARLEAAWKWNLQRDRWIAAVDDRLFIPHVVPLLVHETPGLGVTWALGMPILLPEVDYVLVGRRQDGENIYGLATWAEALAVVEAAGIRTDGRPVEVRYERTPEPIAKWVASIPAAYTADDVYEMSSLDVMDAEVLAAARQ